jgi:superfamily II RNA helicase
LTGRAGRRGKDTIGYAVVVDQRDLTPSDVAMLSSRRVYPLVSSFTPNYNMTVNLLRNSDRDWAKEVLKKSYAQYQLDLKSDALRERLLDYNGALQEYQTKDLTQKLWRMKYNKVQAKKRRVEADLKNNEMQLVDEFDRICEVLEHFNYLENSYQITDKGLTLAQINCEHEVLLVECLLAGVFDNLKPAELAGILSTFVSVSKTQGFQEVRYNKQLNSRLYKLQEIFKNVQKVERRSRVSEQRLAFAPNFSLVNALYQHTQGAALEQVIKTFGKDNTLGDFIRASKSVIDLCMQIYRVSGKTLALETADALKHGLIALILE